MLAAVRAFAKSWVAAILIGLLIISFAVFGMSDILRGQMSTDVVTAGSRSVSAQQFRREYDLWRQQAEQQVGQPVTPQMAAENGIISGLLNEIATREALAVMLGRMGLRPSEDQVTAELRNIPQFFDQISGRFDPALMEQTLSQSGLTPDDFLTRVRDQIAQQHFAAGLVAGLRAPRAYGALNAMVDLEQRDLGYFQVGLRDIEPPKPPTDAQLKAFMEENADQLRLPEFRVISLVRFAPRPEDMQVEVTDEQLEERFEFRRDTLSQPETRSLVQIPARDAAAARQIAERLRKGEDPAAVAKSLNVEPVTYDSRPKSAIADRKVAEAAFALEDGAVSDPIQGDLGLAVVKVTDVTPGREPTLEDVRPMLEAEIRQDAAAEKVYERTQAYEDAHLGGASLTEAAQTAGVPVLTLGPVTESGRDEEGRPVEGVSPQILEAAFDLAEGAESDLAELQRGEYFAVKVERITPPALPPLEEVKADLTRFWMQREIIRRLEAKGDELAARVREGESLEAVASSIGARVTRAAALDRATAQENGQLSDDALMKTFGAKVGEVFRARDVQLGMIVGKLDAIRPGDVEAVAQATEQGRPQMAMSLFRDLAASASAAAREEVKVRINEERARAELGLDPEVPESGESEPAAKAPAAKAPAEPAK
ncbi:MAG: peptidyl-prolyl cis-trans isomerase [Phenylobacterium sp.]|uniref:peptidylprolyl isomerase n=1 Tax=Phenylobacterium sp. TaxID=1871053 RepID=UPI00391C398A